MSIQIKTLDKPNLPHVKMNCDFVIDKKLLNYPMISDVWSKSSYNIVVGKMGQGKTSLVVSLLKRCFNKCFHSIYVIMPPNSRDSLHDNIFDRGIKNGGIYDTLDIDVLNEIYEKLQEDSKEEQFSLLIIDDFQAQLKDPPIIKILQKIITKMRHLRCTIFILQQSFQALKKQLRELVSNLILFDVGKSQLTKTFDEVIQMDRDAYEKLIQICFHDPHDWILINLNRSKKIYKNFDEVVVAEDEG